MRRESAFSDRCVSIHTRHLGAAIANVQKTVTGLVVSFVALSALVLVEQSKLGILDLWSTWAIVASGVVVILLLRPHAFWFAVILLGVAVSLVGSAILPPADAMLASVSWIAILLCETVLAIVTVALAQYVNHQLREVSRQIAIFAVPDDATHQAAFDPRHPYIQEQMARSRRYEHHLSVVVLRPNGVQEPESLVRLDADAQAFVQRRYMIGKIASGVARSLRASDRLFRDESTGQLVLVCPETEGQSARVLVQRILDGVREQSGLHLEAGLASFPDRALTFDELLHEAEDACHAPAKASGLLVPPSSRGARPVHSAVKTADESA